MRDSGTERTYRGEVWWPEQPVRPPESLPPIDVIIPALNEESSIHLVIDELPDRWIRDIIVVDNGSTDDTAAVARRAGARVVAEPQRGYGSACLRGLEVLSEAPPAIVAFIDADYSDIPGQLRRVVMPIVQGDAELVVGSRTIGDSEPGALLPQAVAGNKLACFLMARMYGYRFTDLGPFRAIRWSALQRLGMEDQDFGWTVEMQIKAARQGLSAVEVPVSYRRRVGVSKITGTVSGTLMAGYKILYTLGKEYLDQCLTG